MINDALITIIKRTENICYVTVNKNQGNLCAFLPDVVVPMYTTDQW